MNQKGSPRFPSRLGRSEADGEAGVIAHLILIIILAIGLVVGLYLVQHPQIFRPKASSNPLIDALEIKEADGKIINCDSSANPPTCETSTQDITIKIKNLDILQK